MGEKALGPDQTISNKLQTTVDTAAQRAKAVDEEKGYSKIAFDVRFFLFIIVPYTTLIHILSISVQYYKKAISSPFGQKVHLFYTDTSKQVKDIHEEARRIAEQEKAAQAERTHDSSSTQTEASTATDTKQPPTLI